ncbi:hypothetical protein FQ087_10685 [Sporosarcina sp. ANT_H38]|uniref:hypothetical protein n=1 Tax=Sporosarcina sp. ANT_H38 TaxID=2597358 RepID=UPI0011F403A1|nr:hypothetical protein [Sporosarcina sp. ANT_H38]KAA0966664.1 hypothetical protein FQ087_10685 [Sporosarcina sp. ANT_H38]
MQNTIPITKLDIHHSHMSFTLPLRYDSMRKGDLALILKKNGYSFFQIDKSLSYDSVNEAEIPVDTKELKQYFLPYIENKLFPASLNDKGFHRFTKSIMKRFQYKLRHTNMPFVIQSIDIILGPFDITFLTVKVQLDSPGTELADVLDFMHHFRVVEPQLAEEQGMVIVCPKNVSYFSIRHLLFKCLCPFWEEFILHDDKQSSYFGSLPYFEDERMYATAFLFSQQDSLITDDQLYRMGTLDGRLPNGDPFISATNPDYIQCSLKKSLHDRWAPNKYTVTTEHAFITVTNSLPEDMSRELSQYMGTHYNNFLLHYFYKIMLLRVSFEYSQIEWEKDEEYVKSLIKFITLFSAGYYSQEVSTRSEGKELSHMFRRAFNINCLYKEVNSTLHELYKSQENHASDKMNMFLFTLTIFTVVSGIYGMNLVIEDWKTPSGWKEIPSYTFFEWISLVTALSGIGLSAYLVVTTFGKMLMSKLSRKKSNSRM